LYTRRFHPRKSKIILSVLLTLPVLPEAGKDYKGSETEVLETMTAAKFDVVNNKVILDLKSKTYKYKI
jgi:hypothetical protein